MFTYLCSTFPSQWTQSIYCCPSGCTGQTQRFRSWAATWRKLGWKPLSPLAQPGPPAAGQAGSQVRWADHKLKGTRKGTMVLKTNAAIWIFRVHQSQSKHLLRWHEDDVDPEFAALCQSWISESKQRCLFKANQGIIAISYVNTTSRLPTLLLRGSEMPDNVTHSFP